LRSGRGWAKPIIGPAPTSSACRGFVAFKSAATFYATAFHELGHATGHKSRLDRDLRSRFGEKAYAAEELIAELCAAFLCAEFSLDGDKLTLHGDPAQAAGCGGHLPAGGDAKTA
jgi:antirestriction protein ArdC